MNDINNAFRQIARALAPITRSMTTTMREWHDIIKPIIDEHHRQQATAMRTWSRRRGRRK